MTPNNDVTKISIARAKEIADVLTFSPFTAPKRLNGTAKTRQEVAAAIMAAAPLGIPPVVAAFHVHSHDDGFSLPTAFLRPVLDYLDIPLDVDPVDDNQLSVYQFNHGPTGRCVKHLYRVTVTDGDTPATEEERQDAARTGTAIALLTAARARDLRLSVFTTVNEAHTPPKMPSYHVESNKIAARRLLDRYPGPAQSRAIELIRTLGGLSAIAASPDFPGIMRELKAHLDAANAYPSTGPARAGL